MKTFKRILLWIVLLGLCFFELCMLLLFADGIDAGKIIVFAIFAVFIFLDVRALRKLRAADDKVFSVLDQYQQEKEERDQIAADAPAAPAPARRSGPAIVSYHALPYLEALTVQDFVVLDVETTGLHPDTDEIIEVAAVRSIGGNLEAFSSLVFPRNRIPAEITKLTGIRNIDVLRAPQIIEVAPKLLEFVRGFPIVAHNAPFDVKFIAKAFEKIKADIDIAYIDTVPLARVAFPGMPNYKLATLIEALNLIEGQQQHRAESDVAATLNLFELCREEIPRIVAEEERLYAEQQLEEKVFHLNQFGMQAEAAGNVERAVGYYEDILDEKGVLPNAYMRLAIIYKKQHRWEDVIRVCDAALAVLPGNSGKLCEPDEWEKRKAYAVAQLNK